MLTGCGDKFLDTQYYNGIDVDSGLDKVANINTATIGIYNRLYNRYFAGNYATSIGDIPTDLTYWNQETGHWDNIYQYTVKDTDTYLSYIWDYGYKIVDNATRVIKASKELYSSVSDSEKIDLDLDMAQAFGLRAYANLAMVNIFCHQAKVNGVDHTAKEGLVLIKDEPIAPFTNVERSTIAKTYEQILKDLDESEAHFTAAGGDNNDPFLIGIAAVKGLKARTNLYLEDWTAAKTAAQEALTAAGNPDLAYTAADYQKLYAGGNSNTESFFMLDINASQNWSANSCGTLWSTYSFSPSPKLLALYNDTDIRKSIITFLSTSTDAIPRYAAGKFNCASGNSAHATNYLVNAPEMYLIIAEAEVKIGTVLSAQTALLNVAKRNTAITTVADLPATPDALLAFIKEERARELFQEGFRLWDLRRWGDNADVTAYDAPNVKYQHTNFNISDFMFPIPVTEIKSGFGVTQNDWSSTLPK